MPPSDGGLAVCPAGLLAKPMVRQVWCNNSQIMTNYIMKIKWTQWCWIREWAQQLRRRPPRGVVAEQCMIKCKNSRGTTPLRVLATRAKRIWRGHLRCCRYRIQNGLGLHETYTMKILMWKNTQRKLGGFAHGAPMRSLGRTPALRAVQDKILERIASERSTLKRNTATRISTTLRRRCPSGTQDPEWLPSWRLGSQM